MISKRDIQKHARKIADTYFPKLKDTRIRVICRKREGAAVHTIKFGMQKLVDKNGVVNIIVPDAVREDRIMWIGRLMHELGHAQQIINGDLKFDGTTYIYRGQRYPLRYRLDGWYDKKYKANGYFRHIYGRDFWAPWEEFDSMIRPIAEQYANSLGLKLTKEDRDALDEAPDALVVA